MMRWSAIDPVDDIEIARNNVIAEKQNRNPFVDYPGLEDYIWGEWQDVEFSYDKYVSPWRTTNDRLHTDLLSLLVELIRQRKRLLSAALRMV